MHIIQIGAVKVLQNNRNFELIDTFNCYVNPGIPMNKSTADFTGISFEQVKAAQEFPEVKDKFLSWIGSDDYYMLSWSLTDRDAFSDECLRYKLDRSWLKNYNDVQKIYKEKFKHKHRTSLVNAMKELNIEPTFGNHHDGLADAMHTFEILKHLFKDEEAAIQFEKNEFLEEYVVEVVLKEEFKNNPFAALAEKYPI
jgi:inhibitor of KinA sporulation pathway (predicted exonuclease)